MMEKTHSGKAHCYIVLVAGVDHVLIAYRAAGFGYIRYAASSRAFNVVSEREERIRSKSDSGYF